MGDERTALTSRRETLKVSSTRKSTPKISNAFGSACRAEGQHLAHETKEGEELTWKDVPALTAALKTSATVAAT